MINQLSNRNDKRCKRESAVLFGVHFTCFLRSCTAALFIFTHVEKNSIKDQCNVSTSEFAVLIQRAVHSVQLICFFRIRCGICILPYKHVNYIARYTFILNDLHIMPEP